VQKPCRKHKCDPVDWHRESRTSFTPSQVKDFTSFLLDYSSWVYVSTLFEKITNFVVCVKSMRNIFVSIKFPVTGRLRNTDKIDLRGFHFHRLPPNSYCLPIQFTSNTQPKRIGEQNLWLIKQRYLTNHKYMHRLKFLLVTNPPWKLSTLWAPTQVMFTVRNLPVNRS